MPDLTNLPGQSRPKIFGAPLGPAEHVEASDRPKVAPATDEQVKAAYQAYMRRVVAEAHAHFAEHLEAHKQEAAGPSATPAATNPSASPVPLGSGIADQGARIVSGRQQQIDKAVTDAGG